MTLNEILFKMRGRCWILLTKLASVSRFQNVDFWNAFQIEFPVISEFEGHAKESLDDKMLSHSSNSLSRTSGGNKWKAGSRYALANMELHVITKDIFYTNCVMHKKVKERFSFRIIIMDWETFDVDFVG